MQALSGLRHWSAVRVAANVIVVAGNNERMETMVDAGAGRQLKCPQFAEPVWSVLAGTPAARTPVFDPSTLSGLVAPARRLLARALPPGVALNSTVELTMVGEIKLAGRWFGFNAVQILRAGVGFVWAPEVGGRLLRFSGADVLGPEDARLEFRLHGRLPLVRGSGPDIRRSARGRLAAETVAWLPQALAPQSGARWTGIDDQRAVVTLDVDGTQVDVEVTVGDDGRLVQLGLERWKDSKPPALAPFGGSVESVLTTEEGVVIAGSGTVGWDWRTPAESDGAFFRYRIESARFGSDSAP